MSFKIPDFVKDFIDKHKGTGFVVSTIVALAAVFLDIRADNRVGYDDLLKRFEDDAIQYRELMQQCRQELESYQEELVKFRSRIMLLESGTSDLPVPMWIKGVGTYEEPGVMLSLNPAYENVYLRPFGKTAQDYIGNTDADVWGDDLGRRYWANDMQVITTGKIIDKIELSPFRSQNGSEQYLRVIKYPIHTGIGNHRSIVAIGGLALDQNPSEN
ncbi:MAG: PAS domain-containing protein [Bacteroidota bacterium]